jgi:HAE1 family hydrophobic/amphiphilic exporter-1
VENIHRHRAAGESPIKAASRGAREVALAITAATLTTLVVFIPVFYMDAGELSSILREFAGPITCSLLASLFLALTVLPMAESRLGPPKPSDKPRWRDGNHLLGRAVRLLAGFHPLERFTRTYRSTLELVMRRRAFALLSVIGLLTLTWWLPYRATGFRDLPDIDLRTVTVSFRVDQNYGYDNAREDVDKIADIINMHRDELGIANVYVNSGGWGGDIRCYLVRAGDLPPGETVPHTTEEVRLKLHDILPERVAGGRIDCGVPSSSPDGDRSVQVELHGDDTKTLEGLAERFRTAMAALPELTGVTTSVDDQRDEIQLKIDDVRAADKGVPPSTIARSVSTALSGTSLPFLKQNGREVRVWGRLSGEDRKNTGDLEVMTVQGNAGQPVPLMQMVDLQKAKALSRIEREEAKSVIEVSGRTSQEDLVAVRSSLQKLMDNFEMPRGYTAQMDERFRHIDDIIRDFNLLLITAFILIYLLLAALFESWLLPLSVLTTVPLAFVGVYWALYISGTPLDSIALTGAIILCGLIVNNGIVIIDHMNQLRREGMPRFEAVIQGGLNRLRPVMMTTLTTILGVLPLAIGSQTGGASGVVDGLGRGLVGGLIAGTLLTLYVVPLVYTLVDDLQAWCRDFFGSLIGIQGSQHASARDLL